MIIIDAITIVFGSRFEKSRCVRWLLFFLPFRFFCLPSSSSLCRRRHTAGRITVHPNSPHPFTRCAPSHWSLCCCSPFWRWRALRRSTRSSSTVSHRDSDQRSATAKRPTISHHQPSAPTPPCTDAIDLDTAVHAATLHLHATPNAAPMPCVRIHDAYECG